MASSRDSQIPVVNLSDKTAAQDLLNAASNHGFIFVEHDDTVDLTPQQVDEMFQYSKDLFAAPLEAKQDCAINSAKSGKNHGWLGPGVENLDPKKQKPDHKEAFNIGPFTPLHQSRSSQPFPPPLSAHKTSISHFQLGCHALCNRVLTLLASALEMQPSWFADRHAYERENSSVLRLLYYPGSDGEKGEGEGGDGGGEVRAGAHSDYGSVTLLFRLPGQPGLEILTKDNEWVPVPVEPSLPSPSSTNGVNGTNGQHSRRLPILVNIGDLLEYWTNGLLKSTVHRVSFPAGKAAERYSIAYFCHPDDEAELCEVPSRLVREAGERGLKGKSVGGVRTAKEHLNARLRATYGV